MLRMRCNCRAYKVGMQKWANRSLSPPPHPKDVSWLMQDDKDIKVLVREGSRSSGSGSSADLKAKLLGAHGSSDRYAGAIVAARKPKHRCVSSTSLSSMRVFGE